MQRTRSPLVEQAYALYIRIEAAGRYGNRRCWAAAGRAWKRYLRRLGR